MRMLKWSLVVALAGGLLVATAACGEAADQAANQAVNAAVGSRDNPVPIDTKARVGDWSVEVTGHQPDATAAVLEADPGNSPPADGHQFVLVSLAAAFRGSVSGTFPVDVSAQYLGGGGTSFGPGAAIIPDAISDTGETSPGGRISGDLVFSVESYQVEGGLLVLAAADTPEKQVFFALD